MESQRRAREIEGCYYSVKEMWKKSQRKDFKDEKQVEAGSRYKKDLNGGSFAL